MEFRAKTANHQIQMVPSKTEYGPFGARVTQRGKRIEFNNFRYCTSDEAEIRYLKSLADYGIMFAAIEESDHIPSGQPVQMVSGSRGAEIMDEKTQDTTTLKSDKSIRKEKL